MDTSAPPVEAAPPPPPNPAIPPEEAAPQISRDAMGRGVLKWVIRCALSGCGAIGALYVLFPVLGLAWEWFAAHTPLPDWILGIAKAAPPAFAWVTPFSAWPLHFFLSFLVAVGYTIVLRPRFTGSESLRGFFFGMLGWLAMIGAYAWQAKFKNVMPPAYGQAATFSGLIVLSSLGWTFYGTMMGWIYGWSGTLRRSLWRDLWVAFSATVRLDANAWREAIQRPGAALKKLLTPSHPSLYNVATMSRRLAIMWKASVPVARAISVLAQQELDGVLKNALSSVVEDIHNGKTISQAMGRHPNVFSPLFLGMVRVGETSGRMDLMLSRLADYLEAEFTLRRRIGAAMTYPMFVFGVCLLTAWGIFTFIVPTLLDVITGLAGPHMTLPLPTKVLMYLVAASRNRIVQIAIPLGCAWASVYAREYYKTTTGKYQVDKFKMKIPVFGLLMKKIVLTRFCRALGTMVDSGVPVLMSIELMFEVVDNEYFRRSVLVPVYKGVRQGEPLSRLTKAHPFFPEMMNQLLAVGEETGEYGKMLYQLERFYEVEVNMALEAFLSILEPCLIVVMGFVVMFVLVSVFLPLYQVVSAIM